MPPNDKSSPLDIFLKKQQDCDRPACDDTVSALSSALKRIKKKESASTISPSANPSNETVECPPTKDAIGRSSWNLLHSMAAWYPDQPTKEEQRKMSQFMDALSIFYPCTYCATDFQENLKQSPARVETRENLCVWLCEQHNLVNEKLGKPLFKCEIRNLDERWRKSNNPKC